MKITELLIAPKDSKDTGSSATISSAIKGDQTQDVVPQDIVPENFLRRTKGSRPKQGFRCSSGPRKGRIVAKPSTCFLKTDPQKSAKIRKKRQAKAGIAGKKLAMTKRSGAGSKRLQGVQIKKAKNKGKSVAKRIGAKAPIKSKIVR
mgnify:CR=1 FL=1